MTFKARTTTTSYQETHKAEYQEYLDIAYRLQNRQERPFVTAEEYSKAVSFRDKLIESGASSSEMQVLDRAIY